MHIWSFGGTGWAYCHTWDIVTYIILWHNRQIRQWRNQIPKIVHILLVRYYYFVCLSRVGREENDQSFKRPQRAPWHEKFCKWVVLALDGTIYLVDINETHYWGSFCGTCIGVKNNFLKNLKHTITCRRNRWMYWWVFFFFFPVYR